MHRYEMHPHAPGIEDGLACRVHDPLWLLTRQWQFGEFRHEDAASPAWVDYGLDVHLVDEWRPATDGDWRPYDRVREPLERLVEQEPAATPDSRLRLAGGLELRRLLRTADRGELLPAFAERCAFPPAEADPLDAAVRRRVPDGARLAKPLARLADADTRAAELEALGLPAQAGGKLGDVAAKWLKWWSARVPAAGGGAVDPSAWDRNRLEYAFALRSSTLPDVQLTASEYQGGRLDWWAVDARAVPGVEPTPEPDPAEQQLVRSIPAPARFGGMPATRFWEMEDARFDPGAVDAAPIDIGRLLLVSFATVYGNDWFVLPLRLPVASLSQIQTFAVTDVFGRESLLDPAGADVDGWSLFGLTDAGRPLAPDEERPTSPWFFLAPALADSLESQPAESVLLLRDEMANLAWAVEAVVADDAGRRLDRFAQWAARELVPEPVVGAHYRVDTDVPDHWFPLAAEQVEAEAVRLRLAPLARRVDGELTTTLPAGALLAGARAPGEGVWLHEEEVPRAGAAVTRTHQHARWHDGSVHRWTSWRKQTGSGEGSSGLRFDTIEEGD